MDVRRYFLGPLVALLVVGLLFFFVYRYASSGPAFRQAKLPDVIALIDKGQVRSARLIEPNHVLQVTTSGPARSISRRPGPATRDLLWRASCRRTTIPASSRASTPWRQPAGPRWPPTPN